MLYDEVTGRKPRPAGDFLASAERVLCMRSQEVTPQADVPFSEYIFNAMLHMVLKIVFEPSPKNPSQHAAIKSNKQGPI